MNAPGAFAQPTDQVAPSAGAATDGPAATDDGPAEFADRMAWYRGLTLDRLHELLPAGEPDRYLYGPIREFVNRPSKGLRPALLLATLQAHGGRATDALDLAAALELLHNAFLVHDDIEDGSKTRRGGPTLHSSLGVPLAINAGDAMNALAMRSARNYIAGLEPSLQAALGGELDHLLVQSLEGQALELGWIRDNRCNVSTDDYLELVLKKTAWYSFIHPMRLGALLARPDLDADRFNRFGFLMGAAFQIQDDVLNLTGELHRYGKEIGGDLWEGKRTVILSHAFENVDARHRSWLEGFFSRPRERRLERELDRVSELLSQSGSVRWAAEVAGSLAASALQEFDRAYGGADDGPDLDLVRTLAEYVSIRDL